MPTCHCGAFRQAISLLVGLFFWFSFHLAAAEYLIDSWDSEKGLPDNFVTAIVQTPNGYVWIGTYDGLARFDGSRFTIFKPENTPQLGHARIVKLFVDQQGTLWINTYDGSLTSYREGVFTAEWRGENRGFSEAWLVASTAREITFAFRSGLLIRRPVPPGKAVAWQTLKPPGEPPGAFYCPDQSGALWCSTLNNQLWRITNGLFALVPTSASLRGHEIHWLAADLAGRIWVGTEKEMAVWAGEKFQDMTPDGESELNVAAMFFTQDGKILVAANGRLRKCVNRKWSEEFKAWPDVMQEQQLNSTLYQDREGGLWRISRGLGFFQLSPNGGTEQITETNGLPGNHTTCWLEDGEGSIWVGLGNAGLARLRKKHFETLALPVGQPARPAASVCEDQAGTLWVGTYGGGLNCWQNGHLTNFAIPSPRSANFVFSIFPQAPGQLWISAGMEDFFSFHDGQLITPPVAVHAVKSLLVDRQGRVWLGRKDGLDCWADGKLREWSSHSGSIASPVRTLAEDSRGGIWIGADNDRIYRFDDPEWQAIRLPKYPAPQAVWSLLADADGTLWVGTSAAGLLHFENGQFTRFTAKDGLPDDLICQLLDDQQGNLWLGTHHGICRVSKAALQAYAAGKTPAISCSAYDRSDGLPTLQCSDMYQPAAWRGRDGKLWFATVKGVVGVQANEMPFNSRPPPVVIEEFLADGSNQMSAAASDDQPVKEVSPGRRNFEFHYTALSLIRAANIRFRYQLEGFDSTWVNAGSRRWVQYNYLKPGQYRFRVTACNNDGVWNETGAALQFRVRPYFWETWWFFTLLGLSLIAIVAGVVRHVSRRELRQEMDRLERQRDLEKDRARIAQDIHDHIGSGLTRINLLNELLLGETPEQLPERVGQITGVTCELMQAMDEIVWAVNPKNDTLENLMSYLCDFADEYLRSANIRLRLNLPTPLPAWPLTSEVRHNLFLAVKEILNNIVKHSQAREVFIQLKLAAGFATLEMRDDGRGLPTDLDSSPGNQLSSGNGLDNLRKRAAAIGGECFIHSEPGKGLKIELTIPRQTEPLPRSRREQN